MPLSAVPKTELQFFVEGGWRPWRTDKYCNCPPSRLFVFLHPVFMFTKVRHITIFPVSVYSFATWTQQCKNNIRQGALCLSLVKCTMVFMFPWFILRGLRWPRRLNRKRTWSEFPPLPTPRCHRDEKVEHPVHWCCLPAQKYTLRYFFYLAGMLSPARHRRFPWKTRHPATGAPVFPRLPGR